ncbi:MAG: hypothetical protein HYZ79_06470, partial [Candidatus Melainabacteria bacterium]|nr:hypothetical protein [Candidatus Melainabacteria bacterium]
VKDVGKHCYLYGWKANWDYFMVLCSKDPFTLEDENKLDAWRERVNRERKPVHIYKIYSPNSLMKSSYDDLLKNENVVIQGSQDLLVAPVTDDKPYLSIIYKFEKTLFYKLLAPIFITLLIGIISLFIFLTNFSKLSNQQFLTTCPIVIAGVLGLAYLLYESYLIQKLDLLLGNPALALAATLGGILFFSGIGALYVKEPYNKAAFIRSLIWVILCIIIELIAIRWIIVESLSLGILFRCFIALLLVAIPGFFMGRPLPALLSMFDNDPTLTKYRAIMFGINAMFGVLGMALAFFIGAQISLSFVAYMSIVAYLLATILTRGLVNARPN